MKQRKLDNIVVSAIGMGCMGFSHGYGDIPDHDYAVDAIRAAHDAGCTLFDTAEAYAPNLDPTLRGHNERIVGEAVAPFRDDIVIATKLHLDTDEAGRRELYESTRAHLEASLERLQTSFVDLYYLHRVTALSPSRISQWSWDASSTRALFEAGGFHRSMWKPSTPPTG